jgi:ABC-type transport system substrate-binding protein
MISPTAYEANGEDWANWHPIGTGPYKFKEYVESQTLEIELNEDYWGERPTFDGLKWIFIADFVTAMISFEAGEGDTVTTTGHARDLAAELLSQTEKGYWPLHSYGLVFGFLPPAAKAGTPFANLKVRQALACAVDRDKVIQGVYGGWAIPMYQTALPMQLPYDPNFPVTKYDPDKARQLLKDAGYPNGFKTKLYIQTMCYGKDIDAVQAYLKNVGIDAQLEVISVGKWIEMETYGWEDGVMVTFLGAESYRGQVERDWVKPTEPNWSRGIWWDTLYRTDELEQLCQQYFVIHDVAAEKAKGQEIIKWLSDNEAYIPLWEQLGVMVFQPWVKCSDTTQLYITGMINGRPLNRFWFEK